jgi:hypothetical protein
VHRLLALLSALLVTSSLKRIERASCAAIGPRQVDSVRPPPLTTSLSFLRATILGCGLSDFYVQKIQKTPYSIFIQTSYFCLCNLELALLFLSDQPTPTPTATNNLSMLIPATETPSPIVPFSTMRTYPIPEESTTIGSAFVAAWRNQWTREYW